MQKIFMLSAILLAPIMAAAQGDPGPYIDKDIFNVSAAIATLAILLAFLLSLSRQFLDYRIKARLSESGLPAPVISSLLPDDPDARKLVALKWAIVFAGIGAACTLMYCTLPLGMHSLAILAFCLSASFAVYFFVLHKRKK
ncbi:hypothetical protein WJU16_22515 [Chitinophaga pollutisoli]|uniref:DUF2178 domain-containing protein n=1 Tax=Chitinophaga pollutisoli TaxID=3133966 RepID=A0ABZ2YM14_9BACT